MVLSLMQKLRSFVVVTATGTGVFAGICVYKGNEKFYKNILMPTVHKLDPEFTHKLGITAAKYNLFPKCSYKDNSSLKLNILGIQFSNPVGIAAGFDKQAEAVEGLHNIGFGFVEIGSVTPEPQSGNQKPRVFRLPEDFAVINRYGFNSDGHDKVYNRIESLKKSKFSGVVGVNLGKNKTSLNAVADYVKGVQKFGPIADYLVINISSPNTPGLRSMQNKQILQDLLSAVLKARDDLSLGAQPPVLLKLAPDLTAEEKKDIAEVLQKENCRVDGLVICNTTISRPKELRGAALYESGGLSGRPLADTSTNMIAEMYRLTNGITIIEHDDLNTSTDNSVSGTFQPTTETDNSIEYGCFSTEYFFEQGVGGIFSGADAYEKIKAGASLVQVYTAFVYEGPPCAANIKRELAELLAADGYKNVSEAVGKAVKF